MRRFDDAIRLVDALDKVSRRGGKKKVTQPKQGYERYSHIMKAAKPANWDDSRFTRAYLLVHWGKVLGAHAQGGDALMDSSFIDEERASRASHKKGARERVITCRLTARDAFNAQMYKKGIRLIEKDLYKWLVEVMLAARGGKEKVVLNRKEIEPFMSNPLASALWTSRRGSQAWHWAGDDSIAVNIGSLKRNLGGAVPKV